MKFGGFSVPPVTATFRKEDRTDCHYDTDCNVSEHMIRYTGEMLKGIPFPFFITGIITATLPFIGYVTGFP